jgi:hypothetical protein
MTSVPLHGYRSQDTAGSEGWQGQVEDSLQQQTCQDAGVPPIKKDRYIYIENSSTKVNPFLVRSVATVPELIQKICDYIPLSCDSAIGMRISDTRMGTIGRKIYEGDLPSEAFFLYVNLYLKKHPPVSPGKN